MAAVEKRKNIFVSLLTNHLMLAVIATFIVMPVSGIAQKLFGVAISIIYYIMLYDFSLKEAIYHKRPYTSMKPSYKYPLYYGLISLAYVFVPVIALLIKPCVPTRLFYLIWDSVFSYTSLFSLGENLCKFGPLSALVITALNLAFSYLGYFLAMKNTSIAKIVNTYIYKGKAPQRKRKK